MSIERDNEIEAILSIYPDTHISRHDLSHVKLQFNIENEFTVTIELDHLYPSKSRPQVGFRFGNRLIKDSVFVDNVKSAVVLTVEENIGNECIFQIVTAIREIFDSYKQNIEISTIRVLDEMNQEPSSSSSITTNRDWLSLQFNLSIIHGEVTIEKKSSFQSHLCPVTSMDEVHWFRYQVLLDKKVASATHNIFAYRFTTSDGICYHDCDDDGETAAGSRLAEMIRLMKVTGVAVIVTRWYGGILLGPDRFKYICNSARKLLEENGYTSTTTSKS